MQYQHQLVRNARAQNAVRQRMANQAEAQGQIVRSQFQPQQFQVPRGQGQVDVAGCGPDFNQGGYPTPGDPWNAAQGFLGVPNLAPQPFAGLLRSHLYRLGAVVQAAEGGATRTIELAPPNGASLYVAGFLSRNDPFQIIINSIEQGSIGFSRVSEIDSSVFNCDVCYCPAEIGCANNLSPLVIAFTPFGTPSTTPYLNLTAVGTFDASWGSCGVPYAGWGNGYNSPMPQLAGMQLPMAAAGYPAGPAIG